MIPRFCLAGITGLALASCATLRSNADACLTCDDGITASSTRTTSLTASKRWDGESLPICNSTGSLFQELGPDYFAKALRNIPAAGNDD